MAGFASAIGTTGGSRTYPARGVHGRLVEEIGRRIVGDGLAPGTPLPREVELMTEFQASRTAIREAIKVLAAKGLIEVRQKRGMRVRPQDGWNLLDPDVLAWYAASTPSAPLIAQMIELRLMIEPATARLAAERRPEKELADLAAAYAAMQAAFDDIPSFLTADLAFHHAIFRAAHNPFVERLGVIVAVILELSFRLQQRSTLVSATALALHGEVLAGIRAGDAVAAETAMRAIVEAARGDLDVALDAAADDEPLAWASGG